MESLFTFPIHTFFFLFFFFKAKISLHLLIHSLCQDQSTVARRAKMTVAESSLTSCMRARFRTGSHAVPGRQHGQPALTHWVKGVCVFRCNLLHALLAEWLGSFTCHCGYTGVERTTNKGQHTKFTLEKKILPPLLLGFELATFWSQVQRSWIWTPQRRMIFWETTLYNFCSST